MKRGFSPGRPTLDTKGPPTWILYMSVQSGASIPNRPPTNEHTCQVSHEVTSDVTSDVSSGTTTTATTSTTASQVTHQVHYIQVARDHWCRGNLTVGPAPCSCTAVPVSMTVLGRIEGWLSNLT